MLTEARALVDAFLSGRPEDAAKHLRPDATFRSPVRDYTGDQRIAAVWRAVAGVVEGAATTTVHERDGEVAAFFTGVVKGEPVDGVLRAVPDVDGRVADVTLMVRPWAALKAGLADVRL